VCVNINNLQQVRRLTAELEMRSKWEALRLNQLLHLVEANAAAARTRQAEEMAAVGAEALARELDLLTLELSTRERLALEVPTQSRTRGGKGGAQKETYKK
jgi:hypothetical protein